VRSIGNRRRLRLGAAPRHGYWLHWFRSSWQSGSGWYCSGRRRRLRQLQLEQYEPESSPGGAEFRAA
jgi:hypothetical protein